MAEATARLVGRKKTIIGLVVVALVAVLAVGAYLLVHDTGRTSNSSSVSTPTYALVKVQRKTLTLATTLDGTLGYGSTSSIPLQAAGTVTWLPKSGSVIGRGDVLERVDNRPITLMYGTTPAYRALYDTDDQTDAKSTGPGRSEPSNGSSGTSGTSSSDPAGTSSSRQGGGKGAASTTPAPALPPAPMTGPDVEELEENLSALGYRGFTVDDVFTAYTAVAVKQWQSDIGLPATGRVELGDVVFLPGPVRVVTDPSALGTGNVAALKATSTQKVVSVSAPASSLGWATLGAHVTVTLPNQKKVAATVSSVGTQASDAGDAGGGDSGGGEGGASVPVKLTLAHPAKAKESGPVTVSYVSRRVPDASIVPVTALVALAGGGYGVQLENGAYVPVTPGVYADGQVAITGDIQPGTAVRNTP